MKREISLFAALSACWLLWSGHYEPLTLSFGIGSCLAVTLLLRRMDRLDGAPTDWGLALRSVTYVPWLLVEILKSNLHVARIIVTPTMRIRPHLVRVEASQRTELGQVIYANSITLTPGTITLDVREGRMLVHALDDEAADGLKVGEMDRRVAALERSA